MRPLPCANLSRYSLQALDRTNTDFFGPPLTALTTLSFSESVESQQRAALAFAEITEKEDLPVDCETLNPILRLLDSHDTGVQQAACAAFGNLAANGGYLCASATSDPYLAPTVDNQPLIIDLGGLGPLVRLMTSPSIEVQCNATDCILMLTGHGTN